MGHQNRLLSLSHTIDRFFAFVRGIDQTSTLNEQKNAQQRTLLSILNVISPLPPWWRLERSESF